MEVTFFDESGITGYAKAQNLEACLRNNKRGFRVMAGKYPMEEYCVKNGVISRKSTMPITTDKRTLVADGIDAVRFDNVPEGTKVTWKGEPFIENDGWILFSVDLPGTYHFTFECEPYLKMECHVEATPAT